MDIKVFFFYFCVDGNISYKICEICGYELIGDEELNESIEVFKKGGILFRQGFTI